jgi:hypothetical protein
MYSSSLANVVSSDHCREKMGVLCIRERKILGSELRRKGELRKSLTAACTFKRLIFASYLVILVQLHTQTHCELLSPLFYFISSFLFFKNKSAAPTKSTKSRESTDSESRYCLLLKINK